MTIIEPAHGPPLQVRTYCASCHEPIRPMQATIMVRYASHITVEFCSDRCSRRIPDPVPMEDTGIVYRPMIGWFAACGKCGDNLTEGGDVTFWADATPDFPGCEQDGNNALADSATCGNCGHDWRGATERAEDGDDEA